MDKEQVPLKLRRRNKEQAKKMSLEILRLIEEGKYCTEIAEICQISYSNTYSYIKRLESAGALTHIMEREL